MKTTVSLVLGSGGARGYAHIGVIEELQRRGYEVICIAGSSMGALVGGMYAADRLVEYRDWVRHLSWMDVLKLMDVTFKREGTIRGDKLLNKLRDIVGDPLIEDLSISYTAVATDITHQKEVWFQNGSLMSAIRASIAVPGFFTPVIEEERILVDGGVLNPIPIIPTVAAHADLIIAVELNAEESLLNIDLPTTKYLNHSGFSDDWSMDVANKQQNSDAKKGEESIRRKVGGRLDILFSSIEVMQSSLGKYKVAGYPPDLLIDIPKEACRFYDFHRAAELIEIGRKLARIKLERLEMSMARK